MTIQLFKQSNNRTFGDLTKVRALCFHTYAVHYFHGSKIEKFDQKIVPYLYSKHRLWVLFRTSSLSLPTISMFLSYFNISHPVSMFIFI